MTHPTSQQAPFALGSWSPGTTPPRESAEAFREALAEVGCPLVVVDTHGRLAVASGGRLQLGTTAQGAALPLLGFAPALLPSQLGDASFRAEHGVALAYVSGEMANGIASEALVEASAKAGLLGVFGAAGLSVPRVVEALDRLQAGLAGLPWSVNLIHSPTEPRLEAELVKLFLARKVPHLSASAFLDLTLPVVRWRVTGIHRDATGRVVANRLMAKVSRVEVARKFFEPPPERLLAELVAEGAITAEQAALARTLPMADDVTAEADSGGHTDNRPLVLLLPALQALRDELSAKHGFSKRTRVGAAGGLATPASVAAAFSMGAAYVVIGSVNQATREAGTSDLVRQMLADASPTDVAMAPAADMFEMGVKVQVLSRGTLFAVRAHRLHELWRTFGSIDALPAPVREELEKKFFRATLEEAWQGCVEFFRTRDPAQLERAAREPQHQLALLFRSYLGQASRWANSGVADRKLDFQVWCGPAMGAFNAWTRGTFLARWEAREAVVVATNLMVGAAALTRAATLRSQGVQLPAEVEQFAPRTLEELERLVRTPAPEASPVAKAAEVARAVEAQPVGRAEPIAVVGMGALFPEAPNLEAFWRLLRTGKDAVGEIPKGHWSLDDYFDADPKAPDRTYAKRGAFLSDTAFDPTEFGIPPAVLEATDTTQLLGLVVARMAMEDAGYGDGVEWNRKRASVVLGVTGTQELVIALGSRLGHPRWRKALKDAGIDGATADEVVARISESYVGWQENSFPGLLGNVVAGRIANRLDLGGTNCIVDAACASSFGALHLGVMELQTGRTDLVLTGGVDCLNDIFMHMCFSKTPALSAAGDARPFSDKADGTLLGEGLGMVVLKRLADAERDGDRIYAVLTGVGTSSDGRAKSIYAPLPSGQARALQAAYADAGVRPRDIGLLEAHGTGTKAGDAAEFEALDRVYRDDSADPAWCALSAVKSQIGHTKAAAGAAGFIKAALALHHRVLPPTIKVDAPNPSMKLASSAFAIPTQVRPWLAKAGQPRRAAVSSFGFGGTNFHLVLQEYGARSAPAWDGSIELISLSAAEPAALLARVDAAMAVGAESIASFAAESRRAFRSSDAHRLVAVLTHGSSLASLLTPARERLVKAPTEPFSLPEGVHHGVGAAAGALAFLFPGQGAQHVDMLRELSAHFPELRESVEAAPEVSGFIHPLPTFDGEEKKRREAELTRTDRAQPAIGAVSRGLLRVLQRFGLAPAMVAGHSYGELVALHAAGVFDAEALHRVSLLRGQLMAGDGGDRGTMLAVLAPLAEIEALLTEEKLDLVLANRNTPKQGVLSGSRAAIDAAEAACKRRGMKATRLPVGAAFHSSLVSGAADAFRAGLSGVAFAAPRMAVFANTTAETYPAEADAARDLLGAQLAKPVRFFELVERMYAAGARTFLEVGPKTALTGMVKATLGERAFAAVAVDAQGKRGALFDLAQVIALAASRGHAVELPAWQQVELPPRHAQFTKRVRKMSVPLNGANYRAPYKAMPPRTEPRVLAAPQPLKKDAPMSRNDDRAPAPAPQPSAVDANLLELVRRQHETIQALQQMQAQTARVHQAFLEGQLAAQSQLQALLLGRGVAPVALPQPAPVSFAPVAFAPAPVAVVAPAPVVAAPRPVVAAPAPVAPVAKPASAPQVDSQEVLLAVVAEATGYPRETLELGMDLEADLGIDSIKRVEILSLVSKRIPGAPSVDPERLGSLKTLGQVLAFVSQGTPAAAPATNGMKNGAHAVPVAAPVAATSNGASNGVDAKAALLATVSELTGYPAETLELGMELEADLGIDSIKRVEILSTLSKRIPGAPSVDPERLGSLKTLGQVLAFVDAGAPAAAPATNGVKNGAHAAPVAAPVVAASNGASNGVDAKAALLATVSELTGYPAETLELGMELEADLGIDSIKRVEILSTLSKRVPGAPSVDPERLGSLKTLGQVLGFISVATPVAAPEVAAPSTFQVKSEPAVERRVVVAMRAPLSEAAEVALSEAPLVLWPERSPLAKAVAALLTAKGRAFQFADAALSGSAPVGGLLLFADGESGWGEESERALKRAIGVARDLAPRLRSTAQGGAPLLFTVSRRDGAFGFGAPSTKWSALAGGLAGLAKSAAHEWPEVRCRAVDLSLALGDAESAEALLGELGRAGPVEIGLGPAGRLTLGLQQAEVQPLAKRLVPGDVVVVTGGARGVTAACALELGKRTGATLVLLGRTPAPEIEPNWLASARDEAGLKRAFLENAPAGSKPSPKQLGESTRTVLAAREIRGTLEAFKAAGVTAIYRPVDVRDDAALAAVLDVVRGSVGPIRALVHGAGVLRDKRIEDKRDDDLDQVLDTKLAGLRSLMVATAIDDLVAIGLFASVSGRFGRRGQSDYAVANQALVSIAQGEAASRPHCRVVALDWGPWKGGMVTAALEAEFEKEGVPLIPLQAGAARFADELLAAPGTSPEVVLGAGFGEAPEPAWQLALTQRLDPSWPVLRDHRMAGKAVLPLALSMEWLLQAAHAASTPGALLGLESIRVLQGVTLGEQAEEVALWVGPIESEGDSVIRPLELRWRGEQVAVRAVARFGLAAAIPAPRPAPALVPFATPIAELYARQLFHGASLEAIGAIEGLSEGGMALSLSTHPTSERLLAGPERAWRSDPLAIDGIFQALIVWCRARLGAPSLPSRLGALRLFRAFPAERLRAVVHVREAEATQVVSDVELLDGGGQLVARLEGYVCTVSASLDRAFQANGVSSSSVGLAP